MKTVELSQGRLIGLIAVGALIGSVAGSIGLSFADGNRSTTNMINNVNKIVVPYDGYLMLDSTPVTGVQKMRFTLYESPSGNSGQWAEAHNVSVNDGRFSVTLGNGNNVLSSTPGAPSPLPHSTFNDAILDAQKLYIGIEVEDAANPGTYIALAGRQAIEAAPFAAWSARSADFGVEGNLVVKGSTELRNGLVVVGETNTSGGITSGGEVRGNTLDGVYTPSYANWSTRGTGAGGAAIYNDNGVYDALMVVGNDAGGGDRRIAMFDDLEVTDDLFVDDFLEVGGNASIKGDDLLLGTNPTARGDGGRALVSYLSDTLYVNFNGDFSGGTRVDSPLTVAGNLNVTGKITGLSVTSEYIAHSENHDGRLALIDMINTGDGFCYLTRVDYNHNSNDPPSQRCIIDSVNGKWRLEAFTLYNSLNSDSRVKCRARCVQY